MVRLVRRHTEERLLQENPDWLTSPEVQNVTCDKFSALLNVPDYDVHLSQLFKLFLKVCCSKLPSKSPGNSYFPSNFSSTFLPSAPQYCIETCKELEGMSRKSLKP